jgi:hypothetical protein
LYLKVFIKITLPSDDPFQSFINHYNIDVVEVKAYQDILPTLADFEYKETSKSLVGNIIPKFFAGGCNLDNESRGFFLILEDLSDDYTSVPTTKGLNLNQLKLVIGQVAHFHVVSYAYGLKNKIDFSKEFPSMFAKFMDNESLVEMLQKNLQILIDDLKQVEENKNLASHVEILAKNYQQSFRRILNHIDSRFLAHGDFWGNNVMFGPGNKDCKFIDWQFLIGGPPWFDFAIMALFNSSPDKTVAWLDDLLHTYYDNFASSCKAFNIKAPFSYDEFVNDVKTKGFSMIFGVFLFFYDPPGREPETHKRWAWILQMAVEYDPKLLNYEL